MTTLERKLGESLVRTLIKELDERVAKLDALPTAQALPGLRAAKRDYDKLERLAKRYGFTV